MWSLEAKSDRNDLFPLLEAVDGDRNKKIKLRVARQLAELTGILNDWL